MVHREIQRIYSFTPDIGIRSRSGLRRDRLRIAAMVVAVLVLVLTVVGGASMARAATVDPSQTPGELVNVVFDGADAFTPQEEEEINRQAKVIFESYGVAMAVETIPTLDGRPIEQWTRDRANELGVGSAELNNGLFYGIAINDRDFYVAKGAGYASIPDYKLDNILDRSMVPRFKEGDFAQGVIDSARAFGALTVSPDASTDTRAAEQEATAAAAAEFGKNALLWTGGALALGAAGAGGFFIVRTVTNRRREREEAEERARQAVLEAERRRIAEARRARLKSALEPVSRDEISDYAKLEDQNARRSFLKEHGVYNRAFGLTPTEEEMQEVEELLLELHFAGISLRANESIREAQRRWKIRLEEERKAAIEAERARKEREAIQREADRFWTRLSPSDRRSYGQLSSDSARQRWVSDRGGSDILGMNPVIAIALFSSFHQTQVASERRAAEEAQRAEEARSSSTDYSGFNSYSSGSSFGGGSFDGGGGSGGSW